MIIGLTMLSELAIPNDNDVGRVSNAGSSFITELAMLHEEKKKVVMLLTEIALMAELANYNLFIYQARESSLVPVGFLKAQFLQKL